MLNRLSHQGSPLDIIKTNVKDRRCTVLAIDQSGRCSQDLSIDKLFVFVKMVMVGNGLDYSF